MTRRTRRILYLTFIVIFLVIAPLLLIHTAGYRYDWARKKLIRTGVMNIASTPKGGSIFIDGKNTNKKTPKIISNLLPGQYNVEIKKDGYLPWHNNLPVNNNEATTIADVVLFIDQPSQLVVNETVLQTMLIPNSDDVIIITQTEAGENLKRVNVNNSELTVLQRGHKELTIESEYRYGGIIVSYKKGESREYYLINLINNSETSLDWLPQPITQIDRTGNDSLIYNRNGILCRATISDKVSVCGPMGISKFHQENDKVYFLSHNTNTTYLYLLNNDINKSEIIARLPYSDDYSFSTANKNSLVLIDQTTNDLYFIEPNEPQSKIISQHNSAREAFWLESESELIYYNDFEIWLWDLNDNSHTVLTRVSQPIKQVVQFDSFPYLLYTQENKINAISLEAFLNVRNLTTLAENFTDQLKIDNKRESVLYLGSGDNHLWKRTLR